MTSVLSSLQPQREKPSKDRGIRFAVGALVFNKEAAIDDTSDSVSEFQFWTLKPYSAGLRAAKIFLLGQISLIVNGNTPIRSSENCPDTYIVATVFSYMMRVVTAIMLVAKLTFQNHHLFYTSI